MLIKKQCEYLSIAFVLITFVLYPLLLQKQNISFIDVFNRVLYFSIIPLFIIYPSFVLQGKVCGRFYHCWLLITYLIVSLLLYSSCSGDIVLIFKEFLYSIVPFFIFLAARYYRESRDVILKSIVYAISFSSIFAFILFLQLVPFFNDCFAELIKLNDFKLGGYWGPIFIGYSSVIALTILLFNGHLFKRRIFFVLLFSISVILTSQRTPVGGLILLILYYFFHAQKKFSFLILCVFIVLCATFILFALSHYGVVDFDLLDMLRNVLVGKFDIHAMKQSRISQQVILNDHNLFHLLFGEGFGKYSPENTFVTIPMQDAAFYRLYNELGILGLSLYSLFFGERIIYAIKTRNFFLCYVIFYTLVASFFNRILFSAPDAYLPMLIIGIESYTKKYDNGETSNQNKYT